MGIKIPKTFEYNYGSNEYDNKSIMIPVENIIYNTSLYNDIVNTQQLIISALDIDFIGGSGGSSIDSVLAKMLTDSIEDLMRDYKPNEFGMKTLCIMSDVPCKKPTKPIQCIHLLWHYTGIMSVNIFENKYDYVPARVCLTESNGQYEATPFEFKTKTLTNADRLAVLNQKRAAKREKAITQNDWMIDYAHDVAGSHCEPGQYYINLTDRYLTYMTRGATDKKQKINCNTVANHLKQLLSRIETIPNSYGRFDDFVNSVSTKTAQLLLAERTTSSHSAMRTFYNVLTEKLAIYPEFGTCSQIGFELDMKTPFSTMLYDFISFANNYADIFFIVCRRSMHWEKAKSTLDIKVIVPSEERVQKYFGMWDKFDKIPRDVCKLQKAFDTDVVTVADDMKNAPLLPNINIEPMTSELADLICRFIEVNKYYKKGLYPVDLENTANKLCAVIRQDDISDEEKETQIKKIIHDTVCNDIMTLPENKSFGEVINAIKSKSLQMVNDLETIMNTLLSSDDESFIEFIGDVGIVDKRRCKKRIAEIREHKAAQTENASENAA